MKINKEEVIIETVARAYKDFIKKNGHQPRYLIISPDYARNLSRYVFENSLMPTQYKIQGNEEYNGMVILVIPGRLKFLDVAA
jgi:hypothetical protein